MSTSADYLIWGWNTFGSLNIAEGILIMEKIKTEIFNIKNIDCASCAAKIENGLKTVEGVEDAVIDFASLTLHVRAKDIARIAEEVRRIEPDVEIVPKSEKTAPHEHA